MNRLWALCFLCLVGCVWPQADRSTVSRPEPQATEERDWSNPVLAGLNPPCTAVAPTSPQGHVVAIHFTRTSGPSRVFRVSVHERAGEGALGDRCFARVQHGVERTIYIVTPFPPRAVRAVLVEAQQGMGLRYAYNQTEAVGVDVDDRAVTVNTRCFDGELRICEHVIR